MSFERIPEANRKGRGRIKYDYDDLHKSNLVKGTNIEGMCSKTNIVEDNQDVIRSTHNGVSPNGLEISASASFSSSHVQTEITHDITGVNVYEWFKQRTESVTGIDLDVVMKSDGLDTAYLNDNGGNFILNKDVDMTCIVTNICDIGLGLDIPTNASTKSKSKSVANTDLDKDCDSVTLNSYSDQDALLNDLERNELLDKNIILVENTEISSHKEDPLDPGKADKQGISTNYVDGLNEGQYTSINSAVLTKQVTGFKENLWNGGEVTEASVANSKEKSNWESLCTSRNKQSVDSEKEIDFPEFNLITFQIDTNDAVPCNISQLNPVAADDKETNSSTSVDKCITNPNDKVNSSTKILELPRNEQLALSANSNFETSIPSTSTGTDSLCPPISRSPLVPTLNPRSLLKSPVKSNVAKKPNILKTNESSSSTSQTKKTPDPWEGLVEASHDTPKTKAKKPPSMAIIAISTDKSKNITEIVINTPYGEQVFKGKTTDLMKATSGFWQKLDNKPKKIQKPDQSVTISMVNSSIEQPAKLDAACGDNAIPLRVDVPGDMAEEGEDYSEATTEQDQPVEEALAELGITVDKDNILWLMTGNGQKLWVCLIKDCGKVYPRQSMLKVHILSHFNVRPYRCNFAGCHWSFYTYFKLKRHKETHLKRKDFVCPVEGCERRFTTIYNLNTHQKLHERPLEMVCPVELCAARFQTKRSLELHMKTHDEHHAPYKCSFEGCGKHYYSVNSLNSHSRSHQQKEEEVRCQWEGCGKIFDRPCRLKSHMRTHTGDKPYLCTYQDCGWAFSSASKLKRHQHKHTNVRKFQCDVVGCGKSFMRSEHLREHTLTHIGQRNFQCPFENCGLKFSAKSSLYVHLKKHNKTDTEASDKVVYHCPIEKCIRTYTCKSSLRQHMLKFHTPVLANDPSQLDYIALLTGDDDLAALEGLQFSGDMMSTGNIGSFNAVSLVTPSSMLINGSEGVGSIIPEYVSTDFQLPGMLPCATESNGISYSSGNASNVITHVVLASPENENSSAVTSSTAMSAVETSRTDQQPLGVSVFEPVTMESETGTASVDGSARTSFTYQDIVRERDRRKGNTSPSGSVPSTSSICMRVPSDVVLGTGLVGNSQDIAQNFLLQDDLPSSHHSLYHEDHLMTVGSGVGELQVLLLDSSSNTQHEFAESTINLRDLE